MTRKYALIFFPHVGVLLAMLIGSTAGAANLTVTTLNDSGPGSLRQAIADANSAPGADTITFNVSGVITLSSPLPDITDPAGLTIDGTENSITVSGNIVTTPGALNVRVMTVNSGATLNLEHLTVTKGDGPFFGGGISNSGTLTVTNCTFSGNWAHAGGGISNGGTLTVTDSTFSNNRTDYSGGGISNSGTLTITNSTFSGNGADTGGGIINGGTLTVTNSTFSGNSSAFAGGGIFSYTGTLTVTNSTFSNNSACCGSDGGGIYSGSGTYTITNSTFSGNRASFGGGISNGGTLTVTNSTFSGNQAVDAYLAQGGGGIRNCGGILNLANTIVANSESSIDCANAGTLTATGINLVEDGSCGASITGDPLLGPLADNGGPTETLALLPGSPAIDTADDTICAAPPVNSLDQRGVMRPQGAHCDIGAFELIQISPPSIEPIIVFFDQAVAHKSLIGSGPGNSAEHRLTALRNQLLTAGALLNQNNLPQACEQLKASLKRIHISGPIENSQFVTGADASVLAQKIQTLQYDLGCSQ